MKQRTGNESILKCNKNESFYVSRFMNNKYRTWCKWLSRS